MLHFLPLETGVETRGTALMVTLVTFLGMSHLCGPFPIPPPPPPHPRAGSGPQTHTAILNVHTTHMTEV